MTVRNRLLTLTAKGAVRAGVKILPLVPDDLLVGVSRRNIAKVPWREGQAFMERLLVIGKKALAGASPQVRERAAMDFFCNYLVVGAMRRKAFLAENGFMPPYLMVISPTMRCNLRCYGCYAGEYARSELGLEEVAGLIEQGKKMGIYFIVLSGGEPFIWPHLMDLFKRESDVFFQVYTNGSLIDRAVARRLSGLGNVMPCISVEGFEEETDARRGRGAFKRITAAMDALKEEGVLFGFSATATRRNNEFVVSDEFVDFYRAKGCVIGWYFNYVPVGRRPEMDLMPTPEQRIARRHRLLELRATRDMVLADFWNDGTLTGGCIAGGRSYLHVNSNGDIEPCVFTHFSLHNIRQHSLREVIASDFFRAIRERVPYCENLLRPCLIIDHPALLREIVTRHGARPTHPGASALLNELKDGLDSYAARYAVLADQEWYRCHEFEPTLRASGQ
jgi:MoaA/NifB/PqqE/SkfB family radical SAM enzyme